MFIDKARVYVKGGDGGDGVVAFRREKYVSQGGPAGGDGGKGGDVIFEVDEGLRTLMDFRYQRHFKADQGIKGRNKNQHGANAENLIVRVPPGTIVIDEDTKEIIADLVEHQQSVCVAKGGRGGRGNVRFATQKLPAPQFAENGEEGKERWVNLELKVMADAGLVGFPSVGKSTLLSVISAAKPKIGAYPFTTLTPNLGMVQLEDTNAFVVADLPGLIEGAHHGAGLGHEFLKHIERTKVLIHVVDMASLEERDAFEDYQKINEELKSYNAILATRPQIVAANKMDMPEAEENLKAFKAQIDDDVEIFPISGVTKQGIQELLHRVGELVAQLEKETPIVPEIDHAKLFQYEQEDDGSFEVVKDNEVFVIKSKKIERMLKRMQMNSYDAFMRLWYILRKMGVEEALREKGVEEGATVRIGELEFEFLEKNW